MFIRKVLFQQMQNERRNNYFTTCAVLRRRGLSNGPLLLTTTISSPSPRTQTVAAHFKTVQRYFIPLLVYFSNIDQNTIIHIHLSTNCLELILK